MVAILNLQNKKYKFGGFNMAILETKDLRKIYGSGENEVHALDLSLIHIFEKWRAVDQFPMTTHVETIVLIQKKNS